MLPLLEAGRNHPEVELYTRNIYLCTKCIKPAGMLGSGLEYFGTREYVFVRMAIIEVVRIKRLLQLLLPTFYLPLLYLFF